MPLVLPTTLAGWLAVAIPFVAGVIFPKILKILINRGKTDVEIKREAYREALKTAAKEDDVLTKEALEISQKNLASLEALSDKSKD